MNLRNLLYAHGVKRWHTLPIAREQSLTEHLYNVTMIARAICKEADIPDEPIIKYALDHDLDEIFYGDRPTPAKHLMAGAPYHGNNGQAWETKIIVKFADTMEAAWYLREYKIGVVGTIELEKLEKSVEELFNNKHCPEYMKEAAAKVWREICHGELGKCPPNQSSGNTTSAKSSTDSVILPESKRAPHPSEHPMLTSPLSEEEKATSSSSVKNPPIPTITPRALRSTCGSLNGQAAGEMPGASDNGYPSEGT